MDQVEFDLELFALCDLGAVGFEQRQGVGYLLLRDHIAGDPACRAADRSGHLAADGAQFVHDFLVHGTNLAVHHCEWRQVACERFFDAKTFALIRHEVFPDLHLCRSRPMRFNNGFTARPVAKRRRRARHTSD